MARQPVLIGVLAFPSIRAAIEHMREVLYRYDIGDVVTRPEDVSLLADLVAMHPEAVTKIQMGIRHFEVRQNVATRGFWIVRVDGSDTDFSFYRAIRPPVHADRVRAALRRAVSPQVAAVRDAAFHGGAEVRCPITDDAITPETSHVDHAEPLFVDLADAFAAVEGGYEAIRVATADGAFGPALVDEGVHQRWQTLHAANARLRVVSVRANLSDLRRKA